MSFGATKLLSASGGKAYEIDQSLMFNSADTAVLTRTPSSAGNQKTWTWSSWVKRTSLGSSNAIFSAHDPTFGSTSNRLITLLSFYTDNTLYFFTRYYPQGGSVYDTGFLTNAVFRDVGAWYHIVVSFDTSN